MPDIVIKIHMEKKTCYVTNNENIVLGESKMHLFSFFKNVIVEILRTNSFQRGLQISTLPTPKNYDSSDKGEYYISQLTNWKRPAKNKLLDYISVINKGDYFYLSLMVDRLSVEIITRDKKNKLRTKRYELPPIADDNPCSSEQSAPERSDSVSSIRDELYKALKLLIGNKWELIEPQLLPKINESSSIPCNFSEYIERTFSKQSNTKILILNNSGGFGKTYSQIDAIKKMIKREEAIPIYIPLYALGNQTLLEFFSQKYYSSTKSKSNQTVLKSKFFELIKRLETTLYLFLDGLDELDILKQRLISREITTLLQEVKDADICRVIVATRYSKPLKIEINNKLSYTLLQLTPLDNELFEKKKFYNLRRNLRTPLFLCLYYKLNKSEQLLLNAPFCSYYGLFKAYIENQINKATIVEENNSRGIFLRDLYKVYLPALAYQSLRNNVSISDILKNWSPHTNDYYSSLFDGIPSTDLGTLQNELLNTNLIERVGIASENPSIHYRHEEIRCYLAADFFSSYIKAVNKEAPESAQKKTLDEIQEVLAKVQPLLESDNETEWEKGFPIYVTYGEYLFNKIEEYFFNLRSETTDECYRENNDSITNSSCITELKTAMFQLGTTIVRLTQTITSNNILPFIHWQLKAETLDDTTAKAISSTLYNWTTAFTPLETLIEIKTSLQTLIGRLDDTHRNSDFYAATLSNIGAFYLQMAKNYDKENVNSFNLKEAILYHNNALELRKQLQKDGQLVSLVRSYICLATDHYYKGLWAKTQEEAIRAFEESNEYYEAAIEQLNNPHEITAAETEPYVIFIRQAGVYFEMYKQTDQTDNLDNMIDCIKKSSQNIEESLKKAANSAQLNAFLHAEKSNIENWYTENILKKYRNFQEEKLAKKAPNNTDLIEALKEAEQIYQSYQQKREA